jgi:hypothetical protein
MFRSSPRRNEDKNGDVQVEVSLDLFEKLCSIVVTEDANMQTVVAVPSETGSARHRFFRKNKANDPDTELHLKATKDSPGRLADSLRPLSPTPRDRQSRSDSQPSRGRERAISHSCPPPISRGEERMSIKSSASLQHREQSCPPTYNRSFSMVSTSSTSRAMPRAYTKGKAPNKSKDLVSRTASRSRMFGSIRKTSKIIPAPPVA